MSENSLYRGGRFYQMLHAERSHDLPHYLALLDDRPNARVLELGVGAGRVAVPMARRGAQVTGVDASADMLAMLAEALADETDDVKGRIRPLHTELATLGLEERFDLVLCPFNGMAHQHSHEQLAGFFACAKRHLAVGGRLAFDVALPNLDLLQGHRSDVPWFRHPDDGANCRWTETSRYEPHTQVLHLRGSVRYLQDDRPEEVRTLALRQFFPQETLLLIRHHGFELAQPPTDLEDVLAYVCTIARS